MTPSQKQKAAIKEKIKLSNENVKLGLPADPWVVQFRERNNKIKAAWKAKQPKKVPTKRSGSSTSFKKGQVPHNLKTPQEREASMAKWRQGTRQWHFENKERINARARERRKNDPAFKIKANLRKRLSSLMAKYCTSKCNQTMPLLGCSMPEFMKHLESLFLPGMSFDNYGQWHIDHIKPCDSFDLTNPEHQRICFHYKNLQPLWAIDNRRKSNRLAA